MSTTSSYSERVNWAGSLAQLEYAVSHVFLPAHRGYGIPDHLAEDDDSLAHAVCATARAHSKIIDNSLKPQWRRITNMLENLQAFLQPGGLTKVHVIAQLCGMQTGDVLVYINRAHDAGVVFTRQDHFTLYKSFEAARDSRSEFKGSLSEWVIEVPDEVFHNQYFQTELANFLLRLDGFASHRIFSGGVATESTRLLTSILRSAGRTTEVPCITAPIRSHYKLQFWNRSLLWLLIKGKVQALLRGGLGPICYKTFMLHVMCNLANDANDANLSSDLLHAISAKILRRLRKLGSSPKWLRDIVIKTNTSLQETLEARWKEVETAQHWSTLWKPSQLDLDGDTQLSLTRSEEYIHHSLDKLGSKPLRSAFSPEHHPRGTLRDFFSSSWPFFQDGCRVDPCTALYDFEKAIEQGIDDWATCVTDVERTCVQLARLMEKYMSRAQDTYKDNPEHLSIMFLTVIELWVALDKLAVAAMPMLSDYSPEIPTRFLLGLLLRDAMDLHRLHRAYQYLLSRDSQSLPYRSIFSDHITQESFPSRYQARSIFSTSPSVYRRLFREYGKPSDSNNSPYALQCPSLDAWYTRTSRLRSSEGKMSGRDSAYRLPSSSTLDQYIRATSHTANQVLAAQVYCPNDLSLNEFVAFGLLRSGGSLQWVNVLQELRSRTLNFRRHDVYLLLVHAATQVGPLEPNTREWRWHQELQEPLFCHALLEELERMLVDVAIHSLDGVMMASISFLLTRLLASSPCEGVEDRAIELLRRVRRETFHWVQELSYSLMTGPKNMERYERLRDLAITCRGTFDVSRNTIHKVLHSAEDVDILLFCAIHVRANSPIDPKSISGCSRLLLERDRRLSLALENVLRDVILADGSNRGIDLAIRNVWSGYRPDLCGWQALPHPYSHWLTCKTMASASRRSQTVHLNLLDGTLMVDGQPIDGLPLEIRNQPTYKLLFGDQRFLVVASDLPGMDFSALAMISEHRVHFALRDGNLVVRAQHKDAVDIFEVIPHEKLRKDVPTPLLYDHVHWLNLSTSVIEIRPLKKIWEESLTNWRIDCVFGQYHMYKGHERLVDIHSPTWRMVSSRLGRLDVPENLIITTTPTDTPQSSPTQQLSVILPYFGLSFFANEDGELESRDFKDMVYDENQCIGTLLGLENQLVLRPKDEARDELVPRCIIIPEGQISRKHHNHHVRITIGFDGLPAQPVKYHTYYVDTDLGHLTGYTSWKSKLYLARLHAETSVDWMPDPLTGKTGIEESLCLLRSAGCRSIMELDIRNKNGKLPFFDDAEMYPQIKFALQEIEYVVKRERSLRVSGWFLRRHSSEYPPLERPKLDVLGALRTAYLFPFEAVSPMPEQTDVDFPRRTTSEPEELAHTVSLAVYHWLIAPEKGVESLGDMELTDTPITTAAWVNSHVIPPSIAQVDAFLHGADASRLHTALLVNRNMSPPSIAEVEVFLEESTEARQRFRLLFLLPTIVYSRSDSQPHFLSILVALAKRFPLKNPPPYTKCLPLDGYRPSKDAVRECLAKTYIRGDKDPVVDKLFDVWESAQTVALVVSRRDLLCDLKQLNLLSPVVSLDAEVDAVTRLNNDLRELFHKCYHNLKLKQGLARRLRKLDIKTHGLPDPSPALRLWRHSFRQASDPHCGCYFRVPLQVTLEQLLRDRSPTMIPPPFTLRYNGLKNDTLASDHNMHALKPLFDSFQINRTDPTFQVRYITRLHDSAEHVREPPATPCVKTRRPTTKELRKHYLQCRFSYTDSLTKLKMELGPTDDPLEQALHRSGQWPQITPETLFRCLASTSPIKLPDGWKKCLVSLALLLAELQRARRILLFALDNLEEELVRELENEGCNGWKVEDYPDWLLIQLQGNLVIRGIQADVAMNMISPPFGRNSAMQVNMGEGKSSVILPISAVALADGNQLVRVIVPRALTVQMFRLLVDRLGGLVNRPIYHLPFVRFLTGSYSEVQFKTLRELLSECMRDRGILVLQPEHILSLKLTSVEEQLQPAPRDAILGLQRWFNSFSRDILDESDEFLHPRFQLVYTIGPQQCMEGYPNRWTITQQVLRLLKRHALFLSQDLPDTIEYDRSPPGSFPCIRILRASDARQRLMSLIVEDVVDGRLPGFSLRDINSNGQLRGAVRDFIFSKEVLKATASMVEEYARKTGLWDGLLLLRGLIAYDILLFAFAERRWRVDYGLNPNRTMLAVPYRAKDLPAPRAEFGHPDITIVLTCLSYYYGGLTQEQLRSSFKLLQEQSDPSMEYSNWLRDHAPHSVPESIRDFWNVKIKSTEQWDELLFPLFSRNQGAVDFYLSRIVFPKAANEYPRKIAASSWDLAETRGRPLTGFSGTNDGQYLLPTSIAQRDLDHQRGTNARVLSHLLQPENNFYALTCDSNSEKRTTLELLKVVVEQKPEIHVFLDVGAQILDLSNYQVAKAWLELSSDSDGAVYFNKDDELMVLTKYGACQPLVSSPLAQRLDRCVVYLDDAHTRGTDLKFPSGSRAAVTLGPKVTKDRLVQGCMRMRKLGHGHCVMFFAPIEVDQSIRAVTAKVDPRIPVTTTDILHWAIHETWKDIQQRAPHWAKQGINHKSRYDAWSTFCNTSELLRFFSRRMLADAWLLPERKSLADLYEPFLSKDALRHSFNLHNHSNILQHCKDLGVITLPEAQMDEEQEREVNREIEREREAQRQVPYATPAKHSLDPCVTIFVKTGVLSPLYTFATFHSIFTTLKSSSAKAHIWCPFVLATEDFCKTIESGPDVDQFLRPVQWILSGKMHRNRVLVLLSSFEANHLMPVIRASKHVHLHVYIPRTSARMRPADDLKFYSIPPVPDDWEPPWDLIDQLNLFAGQLYFRDYESYLRAYRFLGAQSEGLAKKVVTAVRRNLTSPGVLEEIGDTFTDSPLPSLTKLLIIRRKGLPFGDTHMGRILRGEELTENDFKS